MMDRQFDRRAWTDEREIQCKSMCWMIRIISVRCFYVAYTMIFMNTMTGKNRTCCDWHGEKGNHAAVDRFASPHEEKVSLYILFFFYNDQSKPRPISASFIR